MMNRKGVDIEGIRNNTPSQQQTAPPRAMSASDCGSARRGFEALVDTSDEPTTVLDVSVDAVVEAAGDEADCLLRRQQHTKLVIMRSEIVDTDAALVPEYALLRLGRWLVASPIGAAAVALPLALTAGFWALAASTLASNKPVTLIGKRVMPLFTDAQAVQFFWTLLLAACISLTQATAVISLRKPLLEGGALTQLWGGPARSRKVSVAAKRSLDFWAIVLSAQAAGWWLFGLWVISLPLTDADCEAALTVEVMSSYYGCSGWVAIFYPIAWGAFVALFVGIVLNSWLLSAIVGTTLASDAVQDVSQALRRLPAGTTLVEWWTQVERPTIELATRTMAELSDDWGTGAAVVVATYVFGWPLFFASLSSFMVNLKGVSPWMALGHVWTAFLVTYSFVGLLTTYMFALASTHCDHLMRDLNVFRLTKCGLGGADWQPKLHERVCALERAMRTLNGGSGMGFMIFGVVIDLKKLKQIGASIVAVGGPLIAVFQEIGTAPKVEASTTAADSTSTCAFTPSQREFLQVAVLQFNISGCPASAWRQSNETLGSLFN
jgi:hypothetical protein